MAKKFIKTFEEFVSFEIEDSTVHIHVGSEETETSMEPTSTSGDEVIVDVPMMHLSPNNTSDYDEEEDEEEDETPESDVDENEDDE